MDDCSMCWIWSVRYPDAQHHCHQLHNSRIGFITNYHQKTWHICHGIYQYWISGTCAGPLRHCCGGLLALVCCRHCVLFTCSAHVVDECIRCDKTSKVNMQCCTCVAVINDLPFCQITSGHLLLLLLLLLLWH